MLKLVSTLAAVSLAFGIVHAPMAQQRSERVAPQLAQAAPGAAVTRGWNCSACTFGSTYCVINLVRYEHVCAPIRSFACAGFSGTSYCAFGSICLDGTCHSMNLRW